MDPSQFTPISSTDTNPFDQRILPLHPVTKLYQGILDDDGDRESIPFHAPSRETQLTFPPCCLQYALIVPLLLILRLYYVWENKRRDRLVAEENASGKVVQESGEFTDATDREQWRTFRYAM